MIDKDFYIEQLDWVIKIIVNCDEGDIVSELESRNVSTDNIYKCLNDIGSDGYIVYNINRYKYSLIASLTDEGGE